MSCLKCCFLLLCLVSSTIVHGQSNLKPAFIVTQAGDTINGDIDYRNWDKNPERIVFKTTDNSFTYHPSDIRSFSVQGETYVSAPVDIYESANAFSRDYDPQVRTRPATVFLLVMFSGTKGLYHLRNAEGDHFYISTGETFELLLFKEYYKEMERSTVKTANNRYRGQLSFYLNDCPSIHEKLKTVEYKKESMTKLFRIYYDCTNQLPREEKKSDRVTVETGFVAGVSHTSMSFRSPAGLYSETDFNASVDPTGGFFVTLVHPRNRGKLALNNELLYTAYTLKGRHEEYVSENNYSRSMIELGYSYLKLNITVQYRFPFPDFRLFVFAGMSNGIVLSEKNYNRTESVLYTSTRVTEEPFLSSTRKYEQGLIVGIGSNRKRLGAELRYERGNGMSAFSALTSRSQRTFLMVRYSLTR